MRCITPLLIVCFGLAVLFSLCDSIAKELATRPPGGAEDAAVLLAGDLVSSRVKSANPAEDAYTLTYLVHAPVDVVYAVIKDPLVYPKDRLTRTIISQTPSECIYRDVYVGSSERSYTFRAICDDSARTIQGELLTDSANMQTSNRYLISVTTFGNAAKVTQSGSFQSTSSWDRNWIDTTEWWGMRQFIPRWVQTYRVRTAQILAATMTQEAPQVQAVPDAHSVQPIRPVKRTALIIGNAAYKEGPLKNPVNDARDMAAALRNLGFEVILKENASLRQMNDAIDQFWQGLKKGGVGLFFFAGHGLQVTGENYLVPVDAKIAVEKDVQYACVNAGKVLGRMEDAGNGLNIVILDACRSNPFARSFRGEARGLAKMDAPTGSLLAYATAPGDVAADGEGKNGLYTSHLLRNLRTPGLKIEDVLKRVRIGVAADSAKLGRKQTPWESSSLMGDFYFVGGG